MVEAGEVHNAATVILISDENPPRTLLINHRKLKSWLPPGGHQDDDTPNEAAIREVNEETGIDISGLIPSSERMDDMAERIPTPAHILFENIPAYQDIPAHKHLDLIYRVRVPYQEPVQAEREHAGIKWFTEEEVRKLQMTGNAKSLILEAFDFFNGVNKTQE